MSRDLHTAKRESLMGLYLATWGRMPPGWEPGEDRAVEEDRRPVAGTWRAWLDGAEEGLAREAFTALRSERFPPALGAVQVEYEGAARRARLRATGYAAWRSKQAPKGAQPAPVELVHSMVRELSAVLAPGKPNRRPR